MSRASFYTPVDRRAVAGQLGRVLQAGGLLLLVPFVVALVLREWAAVGTLGAAVALAQALGWAGARLGGGREPGLKEAVAVTALAYLVFALLGALVYLPWASPLDGLFEAMSGFSTTGLSLLDPDALPRSVVWFRSFSQWLGGVGVVVLAVALLEGPGRPAAELFTSDVGSDRLIGSVRDSARRVILLALLLTSLLALVLLATGVAPTRATLLAMTTLATGGFAPDRAGLEGLGPTARVALGVGMLLGATSFALPARLRERGRAALRDPQLLALLLGVVLAGALLALAGGAPLRAAFHAASALSTTGFALDAPAAWSERDKLLATCLMLVGGSSGSTAGGIKLVRLLVLLALARLLVARLLLPREAQLPVKFAGQVVSPAELLRLVGVVTLYLLVFLVCALTLSWQGAPALDALFESASALGTVGLSAGVTRPEMGTAAKLLLTLEMWAGRLEVLPLLLLVSPSAWGLGTGRSLTDDGDEGGTP